MREYVKQHGQRPRAILVRGADGRLRPASAGSDIGDLWAEQRRIRLAEDIREDQKRAEKKQRRKGVFIAWKNKLTALPKKANKPSAPKGPKEIVVNISMPRLKVPMLSSVVLPRLVKKQVIICSGIFLAVVIFSVVGYSAYGGPKKDGEQKRAGTTGVLEAKKEEQRPTYATVLPKGKTIQDLGGWSRISPPDKDAVFAYVDAVGGVQLNVSQQPLPASFKQDTAGAVAKLAEQYTANDKLELDGATAYVGTSVRGPQSVILAKNDLLILIKSEAKLTNQQWTDYINQLQ